MKVILKIIAGPHKGRFFEFERHDSFIVGRGRKSHFRLPQKDQYFSRIHFLVEVNPPLCRLVDLKSTNGTFVNGAKVSQIDLKDGDCIQGGDTIFQVSLDDEVSTIIQPVTSFDNTLPKKPSVESPHIPGYIIQDKLGSGGMGEVFLAIREEDSELVAIKVIWSGANHNIKDIQRFIREAEVLEQLSHPNIVRFWGSGTGRNFLYFVMEFVPGKDAKALLKKHPGGLPIPSAVGIVIKVLEALEYAHNLSFVHRDIKPANILLSQEEKKVKVKLADFGLARIYHASSTSGLTMTGEVGGTFEYMSPDQMIDFRNATPVVDQFSSAATLYHLLTGKVIYNLPDDISGQIVSVMDGHIVPIQQRCPTLPKGLVDIIHKALSKEPEGRFSDVSEFRNALYPFSKNRWK